MDGGVPVIASDAGGCKELIEDYGGDMFPAGDVDALAQLLAQRCNALPERHRPDLSEHHVEAANRRMEAFYAQLVQERQRAA